MVKQAFDKQVKHLTQEKNCVGGTFGAMHGMAQRPGHKENWSYIFVELEENEEDKIMRTSN